MRRTKLPARLSTTLLLVAATCTSAIAFAPREARAQDEAALQEARSKFQRAIELEAAQNWGGALKLFRDVGQIKMTPQVRYHIATCEEKLGKLVAALGGYNLALSSAEGMHPDFIAEVQGSIDDLNARIPKLVIERGEGAEAASIELDGVALGEASMGAETPVDPGPHSVTAKAPGFEDYSETVTVSEGAVEVLSVQMVQLSAGAPPPVDDGAKEREAAAAQEKKRETLRLAAYSSWIGGGVFVGLGAVFLGISQGKVNKLKDDSLCGPELDCRALAGTSDEEEARDLHQSAKTMEALGWTGVGVGVAAAGAGVVLYLMSKKGGNEKAIASAISFRPEAPASDVGISLRGAF